MKQILFSGTFLLLLFAATAQDITPADDIAKTTADSPFTKKTYKATLTLTGGIVLKGFLVHLSDSGLLFSRFPSALQSGDYRRNTVHAYSYDNLETLQLQQKGSVGMGLAFGLVTGLTVGAISGFAAGSNPDKKFPDPFGGQDYITIRGTSALEKAIWQGFLGMAGGAVVGAVLGLLAHRKFAIRRSRENFLRMKSQVLKHIYYPIN